MNEFKKKYSFDRRFAESSRIRERYPDRIPVIAEKASKSDVPEIEKQKYLVPVDLTVGQFLYVIRKRIKVPSEKAIFIFVNKQLLSMSAGMAQVYSEHGDSDGFLYVTYSGENTFGAADEEEEEEVDAADE